MINLRNSNSRESKIVYAIVIVFSAIAIPAYFLWGESWSDFKPGPLAIIIPVLYLMAVLGFVFMALNIKSKKITSSEADEKIFNKYKAFQKIVKPYLLLALFGYIVWLVLNLWQQL